MLVKMWHLIYSIGKEKQKNKTGIKSDGVAGNLCLPRSTSACLTPVPRGAYLVPEGIPVGK